MSQTEWITDAGRFAEVGEAWDELALRARDPFVCHAWLAAWWSAFGSDDGLKVCVIWERERLVAGFPLRDARRSLNSLANYHTPSLSVLAADKSGRAMLATALADAGVPEIVLEPLPAGDATDRFLGALRGLPRILVSVDHLRTSPIVDTSGVFDAWRAETKSRRAAIKDSERLRRKAGREHDLSLRLIEPAADLTAELDEGLALEASGWKKERGTAILARPETERFYRDIAQRFQARGELRLSSMRFGGRLVAFDLSVLSNGRLYLLKTAYDESMRRLAPGMVMRLSVIERCFESEIEAFELLGAADAWKLKFATDERRYLTGRAFRKSPPGLGAYAYRRRIRPALSRIAARLRAMPRGLPSRP